MENLTAFETNSVCVPVTVQGYNCILIIEIKIKVYDMILAKVKSSI
jgi:hypothetical protein